MAQATARQLGLVFGDEPLTLSMANQLPKSWYLRADLVLIARVQRLNGGSFGDHHVIVRSPSCDLSIVQVHQPFCWDYLLHSSPAFVTNGRFWGCVNEPMSLCSCFEDSDPGGTLVLTPSLTAQDGTRITLPSGIFELDRSLCNREKDGRDHFGPIPPVYAEVVERAAEMLRTIDKLPLALLNV